MSFIVTHAATTGELFERNRAAILQQIERWRAHEAHTRDASQAARAQFAKRGQMLPRERVALLLDAGAPWLELSTLAGLATHGEAAAGGGLIAGVGMVEGVRAMVLASDSGINAGALTMAGLEKMLRAQAIALAQKLPFIHLVESAGANLLEYRVEHFVRGGALFFNLARLSAAGIPVITVVHGSSTAGGAYMPGLSDYVVMVRKRARAFLAGPPLLKAATGEVASEEELGGADMHAGVSGLAEYLAEDDADAVRIARAIVATLDWNRDLPYSPAQYHEPRHDAEEILGLIAADPRQHVDMREIIARIVDDSAFLEFKPGYGAATVTGHAAICGTRVGILTNNGPLDPDGAAKAAHFIQACCQSGTALLFMQNTTGFMVGKDAEQGGMIKHGSRMLQAVANANVPKITLMCGSSFGAGNYGMCGVGFDPDFCFSWPNARTAVMGAQQAADTMASVMEAGAARKGLAPDVAKLAQLKDQIVDTFERQSSVFATSALLLDDGVIDPRDTRRVLATVLSICLDARRRSLNATQFGVGRS
jgi:geranyl-CoA carboxylase beta subunit